MTAPSCDSLRSANSASARSPRGTRLVLPAKPSTSALFLICRGAMRLCALPLDSVAETMRPQPLEALANMPPPMLGVAIIRAAAIPVIDMDLLLGAPARTQAGRYVSLKLAGGRHVAMAVAEVIGVRQLDVASMAEVPPLLRDAAPDIVSALSLLDTELLLVLQAAHLVPEAVWADIDTKIAAA